MIMNFRHRGLKRFYERGDTSGIQPQHAKKLRLILSLLKRAKVASDLGFPGSNLHPLKGDRKGEWAVSVSGNWRVTFRFTDGKAFEVNYEDYH